MGLTCDVSILCANYNNAQYLGEFIGSILKSTLLPIEIVIIDDGSTDNSCAIIEDYKNKFGNLCLFKLDQNIGFANALNEGLEHITGTYVLRVDPDDIIAPERIEQQCTYLKNNPSVDIVGSNVSYFVDSVEDSQRRSNFPQSHRSIVQKYLEGSHGLVHGGVMMKSDILKDNRYRQECVPAEEYDLFSRLLSKGFRAHNLPDSLTYVRIHDRSVSNDMPFNTVKKTLLLREEIWGIKTSSIYTVKEYIARSLYRRSLRKGNPYKLLLLAIVSILKPKSALMRLKGLVDRYRHAP